VTFLYYRASADPQAAAFTTSRPTAEEIVGNVVACRHF
jgi:hypothetical protein